MTELIDFRICSLYKIQADIVSKNHLSVKGNLIMHVIWKSEVNTLLYYRNSSPAKFLLSLLAHFHYIGEFVTIHDILWWVEQSFLTCLRNNGSIAFDYFRVTPSYFNLHHLGQACFNTLHAVHLLEEEQSSLHTVNSFIWNRLESVLSSR